MRSLSCLAEMKTRVASSLYPLENSEVSCYDCHMFRCRTQFLLLSNNTAGKEKIKILFRIKKGFLFLLEFNKQ